MDWSEIRLNRHVCNTFRCIFRCLRKRCGECWYFKSVSYICITGKSLFFFYNCFILFEKWTHVSIYSQITGSLNWTIRSLSDVETNIVSVERIKEFEKSPEVSESNKCIFLPVFLLFLIINLFMRASVSVLKYFIVLLIGKLGFSKAPKNFSILASKW